MSDMDRLADAKRERDAWKARYEGLPGSLRDAHEAVVSARRERDQASEDAAALAEEALRARAERDGAREDLAQAIAACDEWARQCAMASEHQADAANAEAAVRGQLQDACVALNRVALALYDANAESPALAGVRAILERCEWNPEAR